MDWMLVFLTTYEFVSFEIPTFCVIHGVVGLVVGNVT